MSDSAETTNYMSGIAETALKPGLKKTSMFGENPLVRLDNAAKIEGLAIQKRAELTAFALTQVVNLSQMEENASRLAPTGTARYKAIVDSFTYSSAIGIAGFDK